jgi:hypothetical protein
MHPQPPRTYTHILLSALTLALLAACTRSVSPTSLPTETPDQIAPPTESPIPTESPSDTTIPQETEPPEVPPLEPPEGWSVYTNRLYGYRFIYPESATLTERGIDGVPTEELPEGMDLDDYIAQLEEQYGESLCVTLEYQSGYVNFSAPTNVGFRYSICGPTGVGAGELISKEEDITLGTGIYTATGHEYIAEGETSHREMFRIALPDGTQIAYGGGGQGADAYDDYLENTKPVLLQILESYDDSFEGTFDWDSYEAPPEVEVTPSTGTDALTFVEDVTVPDGTIYGPLENFVKTWRLLNSGESTWTTDFALVFERGEQMGGPNQDKLSQQVAPGDTIDLSVELTAPGKGGEYTGFWILQDEEGNRFGTGGDVNQPFWVTIIVVREGTESPPTPITEGSRVTDISLGVDQSNYSGECPINLNFSSLIVSQGAGSYMYKFEAGTDAPGFEFSLPGSQVATFTSGGRHELDVAYTLTIEDSVNGWAQVTISEPNKIKSNLVNFSVDCQ